MNSLFGLSAAHAAETIRIATFNTGLYRKGPGLLLRDILRGEDAQIDRVQKVIGTVDPDILLLTNFDFDLGLQALSVFRDRLSAHGTTYPFVFAFTPNSGIATGLDLDGDGRMGGARDAQGYGDFAGRGGMAILSRYPIDQDGARNFSDVLWKDLPDARLPNWAGTAQPSKQAKNIQRLSSVGHWDVPVELPDGKSLNLLVYHATTPAFDGPEDRNGLRNHDENIFWLRYLDGELGHDPPKSGFVVLGDANLDPSDGDGRRAAILALLSHPGLQDTKPISRGGAEASEFQAGVNLTHIGDPALDTADWKDSEGPGNLRVDYVLPSSDLQVSDTGVFWPASDEPGWEILRNRDSDVSWHGLVWVDIRW